MLAHRSHSLVCRYASAIPKSIFYQALEKTSCISRASTHLDLLPQTVSLLPCDIITVMTPACEVLGLPQESVQGRGLLCSCVFGSWVWRDVRWGSAGHRGPADRKANSRKHDDGGPGHRTWESIL